MKTLLDGLIFHNLSENKNFKRCILRVTCLHKSCKLKAC